MIHLIDKEDCWEVWHDTEFCERDGVCVGADQNKLESLKEAADSLRSELAEVERLIAAEQPPTPDTDTGGEAIPDPEPLGSEGLGDGRRE